MLLVKCSVPLCGTIYSFMMKRIISFFEIIYIPNNVSHARFPCKGQDFPLKSNGVHEHTACSLYL